MDQTPVIYHDNVPEYVKHVRKEMDFNGTWMYTDTGLDKSIELEEYVADKVKEETGNYPDTCQIYYMKGRKGLDGMRVYEWYLNVNNIVYFICIEQ